MSEDKKNRCQACDEAKPIIYDNGYCGDCQPSPWTQARVVNTHHPDQCPFRPYHSPFRPYHSGCTNCEAITVISFPCGHSAQHNGLAEQHCPICTTIIPEDCKQGRFTQAFHPQTPTRRPILIPDHLVAKEITCNWKDCTSESKLDAQRQAQARAAVEAMEDKREARWKEQDTKREKAIQENPCPRCFGRGQVSDPQRVPIDPAYQVRCPACQGSRVRTDPAKAKLLNDLMEIEFEPRDDEDDWAEDGEGTPCLTCNNTGRVLTGNPKDPTEYYGSCPRCDRPYPEEYPVLCFEKDLDAGIELGRELAELRCAKDAALKAANLIQQKLTATRNLVAGVPHIQAEAALPLLDEALSSVGALLHLLGVRGDQ